jgi:hypothetical protein
VTGPEVLRPRLPAIRDAVSTRYLGFPGDRIMLVCDEEFWQAVLAPPSVLQFAQFAHYLRQTPTRWAGYARDRSGFGVLDAIQEAAEIYDFAAAAAAADNPSDAHSLVKALKESTYFHTLLNDNTLARKCANVKLASKYFEA